MDADERKELGLRIKKRRKDLRLTQKELAERVHKAEGSIRQYENGLRTPDKTTMDALARALFVHIDYLTGDSEYITGRNLDEYFQKLADFSEQADQIGEFLKQWKIVTLTDDKRHMRMYGENNSEYIDMNFSEYSFFKRNLVKQLKKTCKNYVEISLIHDQNSDSAIGLKPDESETPPE